MKSWLSGRVHWPREKPWKVTIEFVMVILPVIGIWFALLALYVKLILSLGVFFVEYFGVRYVSRISVPEALAIGYFKSFVEPVGKALEADGQLDNKFLRRSLQFLDIKELLHV